MVSPRFLGPKIFIICSPAGPCFLCGLLLSWMGMLFRLWWWMHTRRDLAPRHNWKDEYIKTITDWARQYGVAGALQRHQRGDEREHKLGYHTIYGWLKYFQKKR